MKIVVCFRLEAQLETLAEADWTSAKENTVDLRFAPVGLNCYEQSALEMALRLRDTLRAAEVPVTLTALSLGDRRVHRQMKTLYALGFDHCIWLEDPAEDLRFSPLAVAQCLAEVVAQEQPALVLTGQRGSVGGSGQTGSLLSELLRYRYLGSVTALDWQDGKLAISQICGDFRADWIVTQPTVAAVGNAPLTCLRVPTLRDRLSVEGRTVDSRKAPITTAPECTVLSLHPVDHHARAGELLTEQPPEQLAEIVYYRCLKEGAL